MSLHPSTNFEIQQCHQFEAKFNNVFSRNNLLKTKNRVYIS